MAATYGAAYNEALAYLGARLVDPTTGCLARDADETAGSEDHLAWLEAHRAFEATTRRRPPESLCDRVGRSRPLRRRVARELGRRIGAILFAKVQAEEMKQRDLRCLFTRRLTAEQLVRLVSRWLRQEARMTAG